MNKKITWEKNDWNYDFIRRFVEWRIKSVGGALSNEDYIEN